MKLKNNQYVFSNNHTCLGQQPHLFGYIRIYLYIHEYMGAHAYISDLRCVVGCTTKAQRSNKSPPWVLVLRFSHCVS